MRKNFDEFKMFIRGKKVAVVGIGVSNIPLIGFLDNLGADVTGFDKRSAEELDSVIKSFSGQDIHFELGEGYLDALTGFDVVFKTPSMRIDCDALKRVIAEGAYVTSEMEEFVRYCKGKIYAITGSDGKTTTTSIMYRLLEEEGYKTWVGGNIGTPLFSRVEEIADNDMVVLELSSFQLMTMKLPVDIAVVTNITPNHLDMHKSMDEYIEAKKNIFKYQNLNQKVILNKDSDIISQFASECVGSVLWFTSKENMSKGACLVNGTLIIDGINICKEEDVLLKGTHNMENYLAAFQATKDDVSVSTMKKVAEEFGGVEHRCEFVREIDGVKFYNDSIASSPTRTVAGLKAFNKPVVLIVGGYDKNIPFDVLAEEGYKYIKELVVMGATRKKIVDSFIKVMNEKDIYVPISEVDTLESAIITAKDVASVNDSVILSPACASFDMFSNFEERGNKFKQLIFQMV